MFKRQNLSERFLIGEDKGVPFLQQLASVVADLERHFGNAASAAAIASTVSFAPKSGTLPKTLPSAGSVTSSARPLEALIQRPFIKVLSNLSEAAYAGKFDVIRVFAAEND